MTPSNPLPASKRSAVRVSTASACAAVALLAVPALGYATSGASAPAGSVLPAAISATAATSAATPAATDVAADVAAGDPTRSATRETVTRGTSTLSAPDAPAAPAPAAPGAVSTAPDATPGTTAPRTAAPATTGAAAGAAPSGTRVRTGSHGAASTAADDGFTTSRGFQHWVSGLLGLRRTPSDKGDKGTPAVTPSAGPTAEPLPTQAPAPTEPTPTASAAPAPSSPATAPTAEPTAQPTTAPTAEPTAQPTSAPTAEPTAAPTSAPTAAPSTAPTAEPTAQPTPVPTAEPAPAAPGARPLGSTSYPVPAGAVWASPTGSDTAAGTSAAPVRTIKRALAMIPAGGTVVLAGGTYHEAVETPYGKRVTIQNAPGAVVWLDGAQTVSGFVADGDSWRRDAWTVTFDSSDPTASNTDPYWQFINPTHPMAGHPDQLWVDGRELTQVGSRDAVRAGTFFVDTAADQLWLGDSPIGRTVEASTLSSGLYVNKGTGSVVRGIGVKRFGTSIKQYGMVKAFADGALLEDVVVEDSAVRGLGVSGAGVTLRRVTVVRSGQLGVGAYQSDRLVIEDSLIADNNDERFRTAPEAGGIKITASRDLTIRGNALLRNLANGVWLDNSVLRAQVTGNEIAHNDGHGAMVEVSAQVLLADNVVRDNRADGFHLVEANSVDVWHNTILRNKNAISVYEGARKAANRTKAFQDSRYPLEDAVLWDSRDVTLRNNVAVSSGSDVTATALLLVEDGTKTTPASAMVTLDSNSWYRAPGGPKWVIAWCDYGSSTPMRVYAQHSAFVTATGQDARGVFVDGSTGAFRGTGDYRPALTGPAARPGAALPAAVAAPLGTDTGATPIPGRYSR